MSTTIERALEKRVEWLEAALENVAGMAEQFDADADFRSIAQLAREALSR